MNKDKSAFRRSVYCLSAACLLVLTGCQNKDKLVFGTFTELDVVGARATTTGEAKLTVGYDRGEFAYVPGNNSVLGGFEAEIDNNVLNGDFFTNYYIRDVFATGTAAENAAHKIATKRSKGLSDCAATEFKRPLLLATGTRWGIHVMLGQPSQTVTPVDANLGFRRANAVLVPLDKDDHARSTYADLTIASGEIGKKHRGVDNKDGKNLYIKQVIATGKAAITYSESSEAQGELKAVLEPDS